MMPSLAGVLCQRAFIFNRFHTHLIKFGSVPCCLHTKSKLKHHVNSNNIFSAKLFHIHKDEPIHSHVLSPIPNVYVHRKRHLVNSSHSKDGDKVLKSTNHARESVAITNRYLSLSPQKIVESAPLSWQPYLRLIRLHSPTGKPLK